MVGWTDTSNICMQVESSESIANLRHDLSKDIDKLLDLKIIRNKIKH